MVSIPFKRKTPTKHHCRRQCSRNKHKFQFPSSGKLLPNWFYRCSWFDLPLQFQFPSSGKLLPNKTTLFQIFGKTKFQFPSSGKLLPNFAETVEVTNRIMFQFPSSGKLLPNLFSVVGGADGHLCFNSLQAGNSYQTVFKRVFEDRGLYKFQFPSSGKLLPNELRGTASHSPN